MQNVKGDRRHRTERDHRAAGVKALTGRYSPEFKEAERSQMKAKFSVVSTYRQPDDLFSQLVRKIVIHEHRGALRELAAALGLSYGALYNRLNGRAGFNPREINMLLRELADPRLVDCLLAGSSFVAIRKPETPAPRPGEDVVNLALSCAADTLTAVQAAVDAIRGSELDRERGIEIEEFICRAHRNLSLLQVALSERGKGPPESLAGQAIAAAEKPTARLTEQRASARLEPTQNKLRMNGVNARSLEEMLGRAQ